MADVVKVRMSLNELRCLFFLAARHAVNSMGFGLTAFCRIVSENAGVLGRAECRMIGRLLADNRPDLNRGQESNQSRLVAAAEKALTKRLADLGPEPPPKKARPLVYGEVEDTPPKRTGRVSVNPRPRVCHYDH